MPQAGSVERRRHRSPLSLESFEAGPDLRAALFGDDTEKRQVHAVVTLSNKPLLGVLGDPPTEVRTL
jgi:hypothetical protein